MATHSSEHAWEIPWTEEPGGYSPWCSKESDTTERTHTHTHTHKSTFKSGITSIFVLSIDPSPRGAKKEWGWEGLVSGLKTLSSEPEISSRHGQEYQPEEREDACVSKPGCSVDGLAPQGPQI